MLSDLCSCVLKDTKVQKMHNYGTQPACVKPVLCLEFILEEVCFSLCHMDFRIREYNYQTQPSNHCKNITCFSHTFFSLQTGTQAPSKSPTHGSVSLKFFSNTVVAWLSSTKEVLSALDTGFFLHYR
jgi:hypothetical protein